jgi:hypothetical protein
VQHVACVDKLVKAGELARARKLRDGDAANKALDGASSDAIAKAVGDAVLASMRKAIAEPVKAREWKKAAAILQQAVDKGEAGEASRNVVLEDVRKGIIEDVEKTVREAFGNKDAAEALARVDADIKAGYWKERPEEPVGPVDAEQALVDKALGNDQSDEASGKGPTEPLPDKLHRLRTELAFWVGCDKTSCKETAATKMWTYGKLSLGKIDAPDTAGSRKLAHGRLVYKLAEGGSHTLLATKAPGKLDGLAARAHAGVGWVKSASLKPQDTSEWLPPSDSIAGTRVWGPLRDGAKEYELGKAVGVDGAKVQVQRLSDRAVVTVPLAQLHFGVTKKGTEVLAMCGGMQLQMARIESVTETKHESLGDSRAKLSCVDAQGNVTKTYEDPLGALRIKRTSLPPRR